MVHPDNDDVVIRPKRGNPYTVFLLGTPSAPDQFMLRTRDEAVAHALAFAKRAQLRAWFDKGNDDYVLLGTFRPDNVEPARSS